MYKCEVLKPFIDKITRARYNEGDVYSSSSEERVKHLSKLGYLDMNVGEESGNVKKGKNGTKSKS